MKQVMIAFILCLASVASFAQVKPDEVVKFKEVKYDFGKIKQGVPVNHEFVFTNMGTHPVIIENAMASCGCTTPSWPQQPILKGKSANIKAGFNAAAVGPFDKTITVKVRGFDMPLTLRIVGEVLTAEAYAKYQSEKGSKGGK